MESKGADLDRGMGTGLVMATGTVMATDMGGIATAEGIPGSASV
ncbi:MAG: hypothetical protein ACE5GJ_12240 [Gemmatimonadota bacterium]